MNASPQTEVKSIRDIALEVYTPPFKYYRGYIFDSKDQMVSDCGEAGDPTFNVKGAVASRIRGWGMLSYLKDGGKIQDELGHIVAEALNRYYSSEEAKNARTGA